MEICSPSFPPFQSIHWDLLGPGGVPGGISGVAWSHCNAEADEVDAATEALQRVTAGPAAAAQQGPILRQHQRVVEAAADEMRVGWEGDLLDRDRVGTLGTALGLGGDRAGDRGGDQAPVGTVTGTGHL